MRIRKQSQKGKNYSSTVLEMTLFGKSNFHKLYLYKCKILKFKTPCTDDMTISGNQNDKNLLSIPSARDVLTS